MIKFKHDIDKMNFHLLHPVLIMIFADMAHYAQSRHNIDLVITDTISTPEQDLILGRVSKSHQEKRALDIRTKNIDPFIVQDIIEYINSKDAYLQYHYLSSTGKKRLAYYHTHKGDHIHLAIHSQFAIK